MQFFALNLHEILVTHVIYCDMALRYLTMCLFEVLDNANCPSAIVTASTRNVGDRSNQSRR